MRLTATTLALTLSLAAAPLHAQEAAAPPPPPPVAVVTPPPPPWISPISGRELERRGHNKKLAGALLIGLGSAVAVTGVVLSAVDDCSQDRSGGCHATAHGPLWAPGVATAFVGTAALLAGIPIYIVGGYQVAKGRRLEMTGFAAAPTLNAGTVDGFAANATFRF